MKILKEFVSNRYAIMPLCVDADFCDAALKEALVTLGWDVNSDDRFTLVINGKDFLDLPRLRKLPRIQLRIDLKLPDSFWYLVNNKDKKLVYSLGA